MNSSPSPSPSPSVRSTCMHLTSDLEAKLRELLRVFLAENEQINLSALRTEEKCWIGNILDSLPLLDVLPQIPNLAPRPSLLDVGTGGGFPLLPLAIAMPEWQCIGIDAVAKKIRAVEEMSAALRLNNVRLRAGRTEDLGRDRQYRDRNDIVTARAVAPLNVLLEYCAPFAKPGGFIALWKSLHIENELDESRGAQKTLNCVLERTHRYTLPGDFGERCILLFRKNGTTPTGYPRPVGIAKKKPL